MEAIAGTPIERRPALLLATALALGVGIGMRNLPVASTAAAALLLLFVSGRSPWRPAAFALFALGVLLGLMDLPGAPPAPPASAQPVRAFPSSAARGHAWGEARLDGHRIVVDMGRRRPPTGAVGITASGGRVEMLGLPLAPGHEPFGSWWRAAGYDAIWRPTRVRWDAAPAPPAPLPPAAREAAWAGAALVWGMHGRDTEPGAVGALRRSGLIHLVVASGLRTGFIFGLLALFLSPLPLRPWVRGMLALAGVLLLSLDVAGLAVARALLTLAVLAAARALRRPPDALNALGMAALVLIIANPRVVGSLSFLLSFAAAATAVLAGMALSRWRLGRWGWAVKAALAGVAIHIALIPLLATVGTGAPFWSPLANIVGIPLAAAAGLSSALHALFGGAPGTGVVDGALVRLFLGWAHLVASWPSPPLHPGQPPWSALAPALMAGALAWRAFRDRRAAVGTLILILGLGLAARVPGPAPQVSVLPLSAAVWIPAERLLIARGPPELEEAEIARPRSLRLIVVPEGLVTEWRQWARYAAPDATVKAAAEGALRERWGDWRLTARSAFWVLDGPVPVVLNPPSRVGCPVTMAGRDICRAPWPAGLNLSVVGEVGAYSTPAGIALSTYR